MLLLVPESKKRVYIQQEPTKDVQKQQPNRIREVDIPKKIEFCDKHSV
jgi:hypothetical protein